LQGISKNGAAFIKRFHVQQFHCPRLVRGLEKRVASGEGDRRKADAVLVDQPATQQRAWTMSP